MNVFNLDLRQSTARGLKKDVDYKEILDGNGFAHKFVNLENPKYCQMEGIIEVEALKVTNKHLNQKIIRKTKDRNTGLYWGLPISINPDTKELMCKSFTLEDRNIFDLSVPDQAIAWAILKNSTCMEGSPNLYGKPYYKVIDKEKKAAENISRRTIRQKAEVIIGKLQGSSLQEMAINLGVNVEANRNISMLTDEVYRKMEENPKEFIEMYENPQRQYISIFNRGLALGILDYNLAEGTYKYNGLQMGHTKEMAIKYLVDNNNLATSIDSRCNSLESDSKEAMKVRYEEQNEMNAYDEVAELRKKLMEAEALLKENKIEKEVEFVSPFNLPEKAKDNESEMVELRERAKALKIPGAHLPSVKKETLLAKIAEAEGK
jgi:hypothetical protein